MGIQDLRGLGFRASLHVLELGHLNFLGCAACAEVYSSLLSLLGQVRVQAYPCSTLIVPYSTLIVPYSIFIVPYSILS